MKVVTKVHINGLRYCINMDPLDLSSLCSCEIPSFAVHQVRSLLTNGSVFAAGIDQTSYLMVKRETRQISDEPRDGLVCNVYVLTADSLRVGMKMDKLVREFISVFQLTNLSEEMITPWVTSSCQDSKGYSEKQFEDCTTMSGI